MKKLLILASGILLWGCSDPRKELTEIGYRFTPHDFIRAVENNDLRGVKLFIKAELPMDAEGGAALQLAAAKGYAEIVNALIDTDIDVNADDGAALVAAAQAGHEAITQALMVAGAVVGDRAYFVANDSIEMLFDAAGYVYQGPLPEMVNVPAGRFLMGSSQWNPLDSQGPMHEVVIGTPFAMSKYEVSFAEYDAFAQASGRSLPDDEGWGRGTRPVINVSWLDAQEYAQWLSKITGERYRLPSEAEWEYAARAGSSTAYSWGDEIGSNRANCWGCGSQWDRAKTAPVGSFPANAFGLHDMHGNVSEWVEDCYSDSYAGTPSDGTARVGDDCGYRVVRGGSWYNGPRASRGGGLPSYLQSEVEDRGIRVARSD